MKSAEEKLDQFIKDIDLFMENPRVKPLDLTNSSGKEYPELKPVKRVIDKPEWDPWMNNSIEDLYK
jgi:hypothetical protein